MMFIFVSILLCLVKFIVIIFMGKFYCLFHLLLVLFRSLIFIFIKVSLFIISGVVGFIRFFIIVFNVIMDIFTLSSRVSKFEIFIVITISSWA